MAHFSRALAAPTIQMSWEDVVTSHAVAAYLFETRRDALATILMRTKKEAALPVFEEVLAMPLDEFRARLVRWIDEIEPLPTVEDEKKKRGGSAGKKPKEDPAGGDEKKG
jgi:hypothetical protein